MEPIKVKIADITNIEPDDVDQAAQDYRDVAAEVHITRQPDGKMRLEAWVEQGAKYPASGQFLR